MKENKFFHKEALKTEEAKLQSASKAKTQEASFKAYVEDSIAGVYTTFDKLSSKLDEKMLSIKAWAEEVEGSLARLEQEIIELNKYLKETRQAVKRLQFKSKIRDVLSAAQMLIILGLVLFLLAGCGSARNTVIYGHRAEIGVVDSRTKESCNKVYTQIGGSHMITAYGAPCNIDIIFNNKE